MVEKPWKFLIKEAQMDSTCNHIIADYAWLEMKK